MQTRSVLECGSPLPLLYMTRIPIMTPANRLRWTKRQGTGALQACRLVSLSMEFLTLLTSASWRALTSTRSVLECGSPLPLLYMTRISIVTPANRLRWTKRQGTGALQDLSVGLALHGVSDSP